MKATAKAPSNIAFIKYWGKKDEDLRIPTNASISMNLDQLYTITTVEFDPKYKEDEFTLYASSDRPVIASETKQSHAVSRAGSRIPTSPSFKGRGKSGVTNKLAGERVSRHLDRIRKLAKSNLHAKVVSKNSFPAATGLSSSASGFAALTHAAVTALGLTLSTKDLSILARFGSGSASRSIPDGIVEWKTGVSSKQSYSYTLFDKNYWDIVDIVLVLSEKEKAVATTKGQESVTTNPFFKNRLQNLPKKIKAIKQELKEKNFAAFGQLLEAEALELHAMMLTSSPPLLYLYPQSISLMQKVWEMRDREIQCYFTVNTGHNIHLITTEEYKDRVLKELERSKDIKKIITNKPADGSRIINTHLF